MRHSWVVFGFLVACSADPSQLEPDAGPPPLAVGNGFTLDCAAHAVGAFDAARVVRPGRPLSCWVRAATLAGAPIEGVPVQLLVEAGRSIGEGRTGPDGTLALDYQTGAPLPVDTEPGEYVSVPLNDALHTGEPLAPAWMMPQRWIENPLPSLGLPFPAYTLREPRRPDPLRATDGGRVINNPRDGLVTLIAVARGAEAFTDVNADGVWNEGEAWVDLTEPFVDADDDGTRGPTEPFVDANGNGAWDGKNGRWDADGQLWSATRVLWTGEPAIEDTASLVPGVPGSRPTVFLGNTIRLDCPGAPGSQCTFATENGGPAMRSGCFADPWFNTPAHAGELRCTAGTDAGAVEVSMTVDMWTEREVYASPHPFHLTVSDAVRDPQVPSTWLPSRNTPVMFRVDVTCLYEQPPGPPLRISAPIYGTIQ